MQDGTGSAKDRNNDLTVATKDLPRVGDTVTVSGTLIKNKDIGSGYRFDVLIEDAKLENK